MDETIINILSLINFYIKSFNAIKIYTLGYLELTIIGRYRSSSLNYQIYMLQYWITFSNVIMAAILKFGCHFGLLTFYTNIRAFIEFYTLKLVKKDISFILF